MRSVACGCCYGVVVHAVLYLQGDRKPAEGVYVLYNCFCVRVRQQAVLNSHRRSSAKWHSQWEVVFGGRFKRTETIECMTHFLLLQILLLLILFFFVIYFFPEFFFHVSRKKDICTKYYVYIFSARVAQIFGYKTYKYARKGVLLKWPLEGDKLRWGNDVIGDSWYILCNILSIAY